MKMTRAKRLDEAIGNILTGISDLEELKSEYEEWQENLPENFESSPVADKLDTTISDMEDAISEIQGAVEVLEVLDLPQGFGRD